MRADREAQDGRRLPQLPAACRRRRCSPRPSAPTLARTRTPFGITRRAPRSTSRKVHEHVHGVIAAIAPNDSIERFTGLGVRVIEGDAQLQGPRAPSRSAINSRSRRAASSSRPARRRRCRRSPASTAAPYFTNETIFDLAELPQHLIVIGAGPIGLELAQALPPARPEVTVLEAAHAARQGRSGMRRRSCSTQLEREGIVDPRRRARSTRVANGGSRIVTHRRRTAASETIEGTHLLVATGRRPTSTASISRPPASRYDATRHRRRQRAEDHQPARLRHRRRHRRPAVHPRRQLPRRPGDPERAVPAAGARSSDDAVPWVTFTDPELAHVGLTEAAGAQAASPDPRPALALSRERPRPDRARDARPHQGRRRPRTATSSAPPSSARRPAS